MHQLELTRDFDVPVEKLYAYWTTPEHLESWFGPGETRVLEAKADARPGGGYRLAMETAEGNSYIVNGTYDGVTPDRELTFTWKWEHAPNTSKVHLTFTALGDSRSRLVLNHTEFADAEECDKHREGWTACLESLEETFRGARSAAR